MGFYPVFLELAGRPCLVVGAGPVAERKVEGLLAAGAAVTVLGPGLTRGLAALVGSGRVAHVPRAYRRGDLGGFRLAFVATGDPAVNAAVAAEGRQRGVWVNAADDPARCDFILPALLRRGPLAVAVGTGGTSPAVAALVRDRLAAHLGEDVGVLARIAGEVRRELRERGRAAGGEAWRRALDGTVRRLVARGRVREARARLARRLAAAAGPMARAGAG